MRKLWPALTMLATALALLSACSSSPNGGCGNPAVPATVPPFLAYPESGTTGVPVSIGEVILGQATAPDTVSLISGSMDTPAGGLTVAPSPLPTPYAAATPISGIPLVYSVALVPTLSHMTTYTVKLTYQAWTGSPPTCTETAVQTLGSFTTQ